MEEKLTILVSTCDKNIDLWGPFNHCLEKYWPDHPEVIISTETLTNPYYKTINKNYPVNQWTRRIYETILEIKSEYIMIMVDDIFIRKPVNKNLLDEGLSLLEKTNAASLNLEKCFDSKDIPINDQFLLRNKDGKYLAQVMCTIYNREKMVNIFNINDCNPWEFEGKNNHKNYSYLITKSGGIIDWNWKDRKWFGVRKGKWCREIKNFFEKEHIIVDYSKRGFYN